MKIEKAGNNLSVTTNSGVNVIFEYFRSGYYELQANKFYYRIPVNYTEEHIKKALSYCGVK